MTSNYIEIYMAFKEFIEYIAGVHYVHLQICKNEIKMFYSSDSGDEMRCEMNRIIDDLEYLKNIQIDISDSRIKICYDQIPCILIAYHQISGIKQNKNIKIKEEIRTKKYIILDAYDKIYLCCNFKNLTMIRPSKKPQINEINQYNYINIHPKTYYYLCCILNVDIADIISFYYGNYFI